MDPPSSRCLIQKNPPLPQIGPKPRREGTNRSPSLKIYTIRAPGGVYSPRVYSRSARRGVRALSALHSYRASNDCDGNASRKGGENRKMGEEETRGKRGNRGKVSRDGLENLRTFFSFFFLLQASLSVFSQSSP